MNVVDNDTLWVINYQYSPAEGDTFNFSLNIPVRADSLSEYKFIRVFWGTKDDHRSSITSNFYLMTKILPIHYRINILQEN
ncbi:MAG: hypothetical protein RSA98_11360, partial [Odoribacter sp.]